MKISRNSPCPCGSGAKYKMCCLSKEPVFEDVWAQHRRFIEEETKRREKLGEVRPIIHIDHKGCKFVVCGSTLHYSKNWRTFTDFLNEYIMTTLGKDWGNAEIKKPESERHPIIKWYQEMCKIQKTQQRKSDGLYSIVPTGAIAAYINVAYDLFVLADNLKLQQKVVKRLKNSNQFQGARHELFVAACCIRAGYEINYEDESDRSSKHPEFVARHKRSDQVIAVEAKSRHRAGVLGQPGSSGEEKSMKADVGKLLSKAVAKEPPHPYVIFIDLNLPPSHGEISERLQKELLETVERIAQINGSPPAPFNLVVYTNHPHHYGNSTSPDPAKLTLSVFSQNPAHHAQDNASIGAIHQAALQYGNVPSKFPDRAIG